MRNQAFLDRLSCLKNKKVVLFRKLDASFCSIKFHKTYLQYSFWVDLNCQKKITILNEK